MGPLQLSLLLSLLSHLLPYGGSAAVITCPAASCSPTSPPVEFPFKLRSRRQVNPQCGYPGFGLSCNNRTQTVLNLQSSDEFSGDFSVQEIDYQNQTIWLTDTDSCLPRRLLNFTLPRSSLFTPQFPREFTFLNCSSSNNSIETVLPMISWVSCLDQDSYHVGYVPTVFMIELDDPLLHGCGVISTVLVPVASEHASDLNDGIRLMWSEPACGSCLARGGTCGLEDGSDMVVGCKRSNPSKGLPRSARYGIMVGLGIPGLLCLIGFTCYLGGMITTHRQRRNPDPELFIMSTIRQPSAPRHGLDGPTIASYPKTLIGESRRLPKPNDNTCAICLCEYESHETLRTIPECGHYFHADCIDEWLKMNGTCPLCRNSPIESAPMTPSDSMSSSASLSRVVA